MPELAISDVELARSAAMKGSKKLLARLQKYHGDVEDEPEPVKPQPIKEVLPPIPNKVFEEASKFAFPVNHTDRIQRAVLAEFPKITMADLKSPRREGPVVRARQIAMYLAKKLTGRSLPEIGRKFGGRDHTTVLHAVRKIERKIGEDPALAVLVQRIRDSLPDFQT